MSWLFLVPCVAAAGLALLPIDALEAWRRIPTWVDVSCLGCNSSSSHWSSLACISIDVESTGYNEETGSFGLAPGSCLYNGTKCAPSPCAWGFDVAITIVNNCTEPVYYRSRHNGDCIPGSTPIAAGQSSAPVKYRATDQIGCGNAWETLVFLSDPSPGCAPGSAVAGWSFTCSSCQGVSTP